MNPVLVECWRGGLVESFHRGAFAIVDGDGALVAAAGDVLRPVFPRSAIKLLQALPLVEHGAADRFGLTPDELALACASHGGQPSHVVTAASMLSKAGLDDSVLECGSHWPYHEASSRALAAAGAAPGPLHNNCSGKHAGLVCLGCVLAGASEPRRFLAGYVQPQHPVMREVGDALQACTDWTPGESLRATDGCSIPTEAVPLRHLALAFARVATGQGLRPGLASAARRLREAAAAAPHMAAGDGRMDTRLLAAFGTRLYCKVGAEGMYCAALPQAGLGIALKMDDGNTARACEVVLATLLSRLGLAQNAAQQLLLDGLSRVELHNWNGRLVGHLCPGDALLGTLVTGRAPKQRSL